LNETFGSFTFKSSKFVYLNTLYHDKKSTSELRPNKYLNLACQQVVGFDALLDRFERNISVLDHSESAFNCYSRHTAAMAMHFSCMPTGLDPEQVQDYLYLLQSRSKTPSQTYFMHRFMACGSYLKPKG